MFYVHRFVSRPLRGLLGSIPGNPALKRWAIFAPSASRTRTKLVLRQSRAARIRSAFPADAGKEKQWSAKVINDLLELPCSEGVRFKLNQLIRTLYFHFNSAAAAQKQIRHFCKHELRNTLTQLVLERIHSITGSRPA
jgi:hypothetical protein